MSAHTSRPKQTRQAGASSASTRPNSSCQGHIVLEAGAVASSRDLDTIFTLEIEFQLGVVWHTWRGVGRGIGRGACRATAVRCEPWLRANAAFASTARRSTADVALAAERSLAAMGGCKKTVINRGKVAIGWEEHLAG